MNFYKGIFLITILVFGASLSFAQEQYFEWVNPKTTLRERIHIKDFTHTKEDADGNWIAGDEVKSSIVYPIGQKIDLGGNYFLLKDGKEILFTRYGTQTVFSFDTNLKSINRLDRTVYSGYNFFATEFIRRDTLYSAGGYGFWQFNNIITYFDRTKGEWEIVRTSGNSPKTIAGGFQGYDANQDVFYSGASKYSTNDAQLTTFYTSTLFKYDFKKSNWEKLGEINPELPFETNREILWTGKYFLQWHHDKIFIIDPLNNSVYLYSDPKRIFLKGDQNFNRGDSVFVYWDSKNTIQKITLSEILSKSKRIGNFYSKSNYILYSSISFFLLVVLISVYLNWKKVRRWRVQSILDEQELVLYEALIKLDTGAYLTGNEVNELLDLYGKSLENQRKVRMNVINQMNLKIKKKFKINEAVQRIDDPSDKRYRLYFLNPQFLAMVKRMR